MVSMDNPTETARKPPVGRRTAAGGALVLFGLLVLWLSPVLKAQPVRDRVLEEIRITETPSVHVVFAFPVRFAWAFPHEADDVFLLKVVPVDPAPEDASATIEREAVLPPATDQVPLTEVAYDGETEGGPFLTLRFSRPVVIEARPGKDFRSIDVAVSPAPDAPPQP
jgi:hypothetical protein